MNYAVFGNDIDEGSHDQIAAAADLPIARAAALMPDAHLGYGLPIGGVLATENAVIPYGVGVDIACRMRLSITDAPIEETLYMGGGLFDDPFNIRLADSVRRGTRFGIGCNFPRSGWREDARHEHAVLDSSDWKATEELQGLQDTAWAQLGTSGSGNHFVEWGLVTVDPELAQALGGEMLPGKYVGLLSHSGSRGPGARTCNKYTKLAKEQNPAGELSWLDLDTAEGQEYWLAMNLMGEFAKANHECIHQRVLELAGLRSIGFVENHHNFAWEENGLIVHRKGATPAQKGVLGVIPGSMASPAYIVVGKGNEESLDSASHGAGRRMSRTACKKTLSWDEARADMKEKKIWLLDAGLDEVMGAYKNIDEVMACQTELVDKVGQFDPKIVLMDGSGSRAED